MNKLLLNRQELEQLTKQLEAIMDSPYLLEIARLAIEDELVLRRDHRISIMRNNGLTIKESDGSTNSNIRMSHEEALCYGLKAIIATYKRWNYDPEG